MYLFGHKSQTTAQHFCAECGRALFDQKEGVAIDEDGCAEFGGVKSCQLTMREIQVLRVLRASFGEVVHRETIFSRVWGDAEANPRIIDVIVSFLRLELKPLGLQVKATNGVGYRLSRADQTASTK